jgi:hypothetical protein
MADALSSLLLLDSVDPQGAALDVTKGFVSEAAKDERIKKAILTAYEWLRRPVAVDPGVQRTIPDFQKLHGVTPEFQDGMCALYLLVLDRLRAAKSRDAVRERLRDPEAVLAEVERQTGRDDNEFIKSLVHDASRRAGHSPTFAATLEGAAKELRQLAGAVRGDEMSALLKIFAGAQSSPSGLPPIKGGQTSGTICSIPSGSLAGDIFCIVMIILVIIAILLGILL